MKLRYKVIPVQTKMRCPVYAVVDTIHGMEEELGRFDCSYWASKKALELNRKAEEEELMKNPPVPIKKKRYYIQHG